jgi:beta-phosphoglucomutase
MSDWPGAVLFDFDGVIVNSEPLHFLALHQTMQEQGIDDLTEDEYYTELLGLNDRDAVRTLLARRNRPSEPRTLLALVARKSRAMMELIEQRKVHALPGVEALVRGLWRNYPLAICSGALREEIDAMLIGVALRDCFDVIIAAEDVINGKPDPEGYLLAMAQLAERHHRKLRPADCLIIEDAPTVIGPMRRAGFKVLGLASSYPPERLADADYVVRSLRPQEVLEKVPGLKITA